MKRLGIVMTVFGGLLCLYQCACIVELVEPGTLKRIVRICPQGGPPPCVEFPVRD